MKVSEIIAAINAAAPEYTQESWDNSGLQVGLPNNDVNRILLCVDVLPSVIAEAKEIKADMIISHHPLLFAGVRKITSDAQSEMLRELIKSDISLYSSHTSFDASPYGTNAYMAKLLGLINTSFLDELSEIRSELTLFVPNQCVGDAMRIFDEAGVLAHLLETRGGESLIISDIFTSQIGSLLRKIKRLAPLRYSQKPLSAGSGEYGVGLLGELPQKMAAEELIALVKEKLRLSHLRVSSNYVGKKISRLGLCTGSGADYMKLSARMNADAYLCADLKWSNFLDAEKMGLVLLCPSHFETERCFIPAMRDILSTQCGEIAILSSKVKDIEAIL